MNPELLDALMLAAGTDKSSDGHDYAAAYSAILRPFLGRPIVLLEIGAAQGASLRVWRECLPLASVYGIDNNPDSLAGFTADGVFIGDQTDAALLTGVAERVGPLDVVIDDGGHKASEQVASFEALFPGLNSGGLYVVEDTHAWYAEGYIDQTPSAREFFLGLVDAVNVDGRGGTGNYEQALAWSRDLGVALPAWSGHIASLQFFQSLLATWRR